MLALIEKARSLGALEISLLAQLTAIRFYEKCGFTVADEAIIMDAELNING